MRISDWSSDVCSSDLTSVRPRLAPRGRIGPDGTDIFNNGRGRMSMRLALSDSGPALAPISPRRELGAYEALWLEKGATFKTLADRFALDAAALPSDFVAPQLAEQCAAEVMAKLDRKSVVLGNRVSVRLVFGCRRYIKK